MPSPINLADPAFEPTGEQLQALASRAFAGVRAARAQSLERLHAEIARQRDLVLRSLGQARIEQPKPGQDP